MAMYIDYIKGDEHIADTYHMVNNGTGIVCPNNFINKDNRKSMLISPTLFVQLDGDELSFVETYFTGLPSAKKRVVTYMGEFARFIVSNLPQ